MPIGWVAAAGVASAAIGAYGAQSAASTQADAANNATNLQYQMFQQGQANLEPYKQAGTVGLNALSSAMFNPDGSINAVRDLPGVRESVEEYLSRTEASVIAERVHESHVQAFDDSAKLIRSVLHGEMPAPIAPPGSTAASSAP